MRKIAVVLLLVVVASALSIGQQKSSHKIPRQRAAKIALSQVRHGKIQSAELEKELGRLVWSFDIASGDDITEVLVDAQSGEVVKVEKESASSELAEQGMDRAEHIALRRIPGEVATRDSTMQRGAKVYRFHIKTREGETVKVDVTPAGKIIDIQTLEEEDGEDPGE